MAYSREIYEEAAALLAKRRADAVAKAGALRERMLAKYPELADIEQAMSRSSLQVARAVLDGGNVEATVERIKQENLAMQTQMAELLRRAGEKATDMQPQYECPHCRDTGYVNGHICSCFSALMREAACRRICRFSPMKLTDFHTLDLSYYPNTTDTRTGISPRSRMAEVIQYARFYAEDFSLQSPNLLLTGPTGTGKTHVSLAIAKQVSDKGYSVVYSPVQQLVNQLEKEHFGRSNDNSEEILLQCDLLVLDDLGTEFCTPFCVSALYNLINSRALEERPTIISTNMNAKQLRERYGEQITSRIVGLYQPLLFFGKDIRQMLNEKNR